MGFDENEGIFGNYSYYSKIINSIKNIYLDDPLLNSILTTR